MGASFVAYIDESGDEGFRFREDGSGSSRWFVLSALVVRKEYDRDEIIPAARDLREILRKEPKKALHFRELRHEQRIPIARRIGSMRVRTVSVVVHKPCIESPENFQREPYSLYRYCSRLLMERISWLCRDSHDPNAGDGRVELIYSNRSRMSYDDLTAYLDKLKFEIPHQVRIEWSAIDSSMVRAVNHDQLAGLQLADAVASGVYFGVNTNLYGETEPRYAQLMSPTLYRHRSRTAGYGLKFWCGCHDELSRFMAAVDPQ